MIQKKIVWNPHALFINQTTSTNLFSLKNYQYTAFLWTLNSTELPFLHQHKKYTNSF